MNTLEKLATRQIISMKGYLEESEAREQILPPVSEFMSLNHTIVV